MVRGEWRQGKGAANGEESTCRPLFVPSDEQPFISNREDFIKLPERTILRTDPDFPWDGRCDGEMKIFVDWEFDTKTFYDTASVCTQVVEFSQYSMRRKDCVDDYCQEFFFDMMEEYDSRLLSNQKSFFEALREIQHAKIYVIGWGMVNDMQFVRKYLTEFDAILDLQLVAAEAKLPQGLDKVVLELFNEVVDKRFQKCNWGLRPLTVEQMRYCMGDATWLPKVFRRLKPHIQESHFVRSQELFATHSLRLHVYKPSDWGMGDKPAEWRYLMYFLWERREKVGEKNNWNVGRVFAKDAFKALSARLYHKWFVERDESYAEFVSFYEFSPVLYALTTNAGAF